MSRRIWILAGGGLLLVAAVMGALLVGLIGRPAEATIALDLPASGETRADYLPDGRPVWVVGHQNGHVDVLSAFSTHAPGGVMKLTWWCLASRTIDDPSSGAWWNEYGRRAGGPTHLNLGGWSTRIEGNEVLLVGAEVQPTEATGTTSSSAERCVNGVNVVVHRFEGWRRWDSPQAAFAAHPTNWILIAGRRVTRSDGSVLLCALSGCEDSAVLGGVSPLPTDRPASEPPRDELVIVRVRDGQLEGLTRIVSGL